MQRVLVVEDDEALTRAFEVALVHSGFVVDVAENGKRARARALAAANPPDVIVLDSQMPVLDGRGFARMYRRATARPAPIIAITGRHDPGLFAALVGAAAYVRKPVPIADLVATVRRLTYSPSGRV